MGKYLAVLAALMLLLSLDVCICFADEDTIVLSPNTNILSVDSYDLHEVSAYGNGPLGLINNMKSTLVPADDSVEKLRKTMTFSSGAELLQMDDVSDFAATDGQGNVHGSGFERSLTLKDFSYPFAIMREDLMQLSGNGATLGGTSSKTILFLPSTDMYDMDENMKELSSAFGGTSKIYIKTFKYDTDFKVMFSEMGIDLGMFMGQANFAEMFASFRDPQLWALLEAARESNNPRVEEINRRNYIDSSNGVVCRWGYDKGVDTAA
jgi:hypothetical protein